ncbi:Putative alpha/Beta hydrolase, feruloyl esterase B/C/D [Septoria linicola]|uniref:feruloyl esterase n=1 Tax=Septoria linicola TaxID=215465 RepID=A0A9Q9AXZ2_9PEZI|nr:putative alpha/Beta hydrolase, feruloyl esterase B/C/D [Septoria linicola]USW53967.1 Putative alpha/Beta hydrolase, feruloyl esterase B/C/D [Septoria linicola]
MFSTLVLSAVTASLVAAAPHPNAALTPACKLTHHEGFGNDTKTHTITSGRYNRTYAVNVPAGYNKKLGKRWPLILDFHGNSGTPWQQYINSRYFDYAAGQEYIAVYPAGVDESWQGASYSVKDANDLQFVTDLTAYLRTQYCIDDDHVYASGKSNGGGFVDLLACSKEGDQFAAFAMAAPALYPDTKLSSCTKKRAILQSHGDKDETIPYHPGGKNGTGGPLPDITEWVSWWGRRTCGAKAKAEYSKDLGGYNTTIYSCGDYHEVIKHYQVFELGHCWPSSTSSNWDASDRYNQTKRRCLDKSLDFTPVVLDFFSKWDLQNAPSN